MPAVERHRAKSFLRSTSLPVREEAIYFRNKATIERPRQRRLVVTKPLLTPAAPPQRRATTSSPTSLLPPSPPPTTSVASSHINKRDEWDSVFIHTRTRVYTDASRDADCAERTASLEGPMRNGRDGARAHVLCKHVRASLLRL